MPVALITAADGVYYPTSADSADRADVVFAQTAAKPGRFIFLQVSLLGLSSTLTFL